MKTGHGVLVAGPNYREIETEGEAGLEVHAATVLGEIGHDKKGRPDLGDDLVIDAIRVLDSVNADGVIDFRNSTLILMNFGAEAHAILCFC